MNFALLPFAALLVLLAGFSSRAQAGAPSRSAEAELRDGQLQQDLLRELLGGVTGTQRPSSSRAAALVRLQHGRARRMLAAVPSLLCVVALTAPSVPDRTPAPDVPAVRVTPGPGRKAFRARFGFAEGAYQPLGPPLLG